MLEKYQVQLHANFSKYVQTLLKKQLAHLQCVHNNSAKFEKCQPKGASDFDYTN
jgi:hypothetical protein